jgi:hypothetical protein
MFPPNHLDGIDEILLPDGWHRIRPGSLWIAQYELQRGDPPSVVLSMTSYGAGQASFAFTAVDAEDGSGLYGPLSAIHAYRSGTPHDTSTDSRGHSKQQQRTGVNA